MVEKKQDKSEIDNYKAMYNDQLNLEDDSYNGKFTHFDSHNESVIEI